MGICSAFTPSWESAAQRKHDGEPGFRHAAKAGDTPVETSWDNRAHRRGGAATATRNPLQGNCPVVTAGSACLHCTKYRSWKTPCQVFILSHQLFTDVVNINT